MICTRCGDAGHLNKYCPTIGDPKCDPVEHSRIANIPKALRTTVDTLDGIDMTNKTAIQNEDGTYDIVSASASGLKALARDGCVQKLNCLLDNKRNAAETKTTMATIVLSG